MSEDRFLEGLTDEERLDHLRVLSRGQQAALKYLLGRLTSYHDLLELELEDSPAGQLYLKEAQQTLDRAGLAMTRAGLPTDVGRAVDSFDLRVLLTGIAARLRRIGKAEVEVAAPEGEDEEAMVEGTVHLLQQAIFDLVAELTEDPEKPPRLVFGLATRRLEQEYLRSRKSFLAGGRYHLLTVRRAENRPELDQLTSVGERLGGSTSIELDQRLVYILGVVTEHGGEMFLPRSGSNVAAFTILLPARDGEGMFEEATLDDAAVRGSETILLVDDEAIIWDVVIDMLHSLGYTVILAADGQDCVEIYRDNLGLIDVVLLDMVMPQMTGREAFFKLQEIDPQVRVLLQSGYVAEEDARDVLDAGAAGFLRKPYRLMDLARKIRSICDG